VLHNSEAVLRLAISTSAELCGRYVKKK